MPSRRLAEHQLHNLAMTNGPSGSFWLATRFATRSDSIKLLFLLVLVPTWPYSCSKCVPSVAHPHHHVALRERLVPLPPV